MNAVRRSQRPPQSCQLGLSMSQRLAEYNRHMIIQRTFNRYYQMYCILVFHLVYVHGATWPFTAVCSNITVDPRFDCFNHAHRRIVRHSDRCWLPPAISNKITTSRPYQTGVGLTWIYCASDYELISDLLITNSGLRSPPHLLCGRSWRTSRIHEQKGAIE